MIYEATIDNLRMLLRTCGVLEREQLYRFFSSCQDAGRMDFYIDQLTREKVFLSNPLYPNRVIYRHQAFPHVKQAELSKRLQAFWVIASFGCDNILDVSLMEYPTQYMFITSGNEVYDLTVCKQAADGFAALRKREELMRRMPVGVEDEVNHIAVVDSESVGKAIERYGFDSFCILDADRVPRYQTWE